MFMILIFEHQAYQTRCLSDALVAAVVAALLSTTCTRAAADALHSQFMKFIGLLNLSLDPDISL
jgi:hypothetical protein